MRRGVITSAHAGTLVTLFAVATALTIALTRVYLDLSGYPSVGGKTYHLAHALWGGLLLMIACVLLLALRGRWVDPTSAIIGGIGAGLFVDEVGKFITRSNNYFFPLAAPIVYLCIIALAYAAYAAGRTRRHTAPAHLQAGFDLARELIDGPATPALLTEIRTHAEAAESLATTEEQVRLARGLGSMTLLTPEGTGAVAAPWWSRALAAIRRLEARLLPGDRYRKVMRGLLVIAALSSVLGGLFVLPVAVAGSYDPALVPVTFERTTGSAGRLSFILYAVGGAVSVVVGFVFFRAARSLRAQHLDIPAAWHRTTIGAVLSMAVVNAAGAYIDQFASLTGLATNALLLLVMASFTTASGHSLDEDR